MCQDPMMKPVFNKSISVKSKVGSREKKFQEMTLATGSSPNWSGRLIGSLVDRHTNWAMQPGALFLASFSHLSLTSHKLQKSDRI